MLASLRIPERAPERVKLALLRSALAGLVRSNRIIMSLVQLPPLYRSGVRYQREPKGRERWQSADETRKVGVGDCEDLASWRAAELQEAGYDVIADVIKTGPRRYHAIVRWPGDRVEDPSRRLHPSRYRG